MTHEITLRKSDLSTAATVGLFRAIKAIADGRRHRHGLNGFGFDEHIVGAIGEFALAKLLGYFWDPAIGIASPGDVGDLEVRTTAHKNGRLIIHRDDTDLAAFFLLRVHDLPQIEIIGYIMGKDAKRDEWWKDPTGNNRAAFFVPESALNPIHQFGEEKGF